MLNLRAGGIIAISACIYYVMMRRVLGPLDGKNETQTTTETIMDVVAGDRAAGAAAVARRAAISLAGTGERWGARDEEEHSGHHGQTVLPGIRQRVDRHPSVFPTASNSFGRQNKSAPGRFRREIQTLARNSAASEDCQRDLSNTVRRERRAPHAL